MVGLVRVARKDAADLVLDHFQRLLLLLGKVGPAGLLTHGGLEALHDRPVGPEVSVGLTALDEGPGEVRQLRHFFSPSVNVRGLVGLVRRTRD